MIARLALDPHVLAPRAEAAAVVEDPLAVARRIRDAFGAPITFERPDAGPGDPAAGGSLGDCTMVLYALSPATSEALWGRIDERPRSQGSQLVLRE